MKFVTATITDRGGRETNQDCVRTAAEIGGVCAVVADGLGAYDGSDAASRICAETVTQAYAADPVAGDDPEALKRLIRQAHDRIAEYKETSGCTRICTTVACAVADRKGVAFAHIGDSRVYAVRNGRIELLTRDHSLARIAVDRGEIALRDICRHRDQNKLTRVLGNDYYVAPDCDSLPPLSAGDGIILCTDGVWEYVYDEDMERLFNENEPKDVLYAFARLIDERKTGPNDNYTAAIIKAVAL